MKPAVVILFLLVLCLLATTVFAADINGRVNLGSGYFAHPLGLQYDTAAGYLSSGLILDTSLKSESYAVRFGYEGNITRFGGDTNLGSRRHALGAEWFRNTSRHRSSLSAGVQASVRNHDGYYGVYDYLEGYGYFAFKRYFGAQTLGRGYAAMRVRRYDDLPEESFVEPHAHLEVQRYSESRTTLGLAIDYGIKTFDDPIASRIWETLESPSTSQIAARFNFAQGFSERVALRGWLNRMWSLADFPHYVADDIYDSPVLDHYAYEGLDSSLILKILGPSQTWLELGGSWGRHDYGEMLFASGESGLKREDDVAAVFLGVERKLGGRMTSPLWRLQLGWRDQVSSIPNYDYSGTYITSSLSLKW